MNEPNKDSQSSSVENISYADTNLDLSLLSHISDNQHLSFNTNDSVCSDLSDSTSNIHPVVVKQLTKIIENKLDYHLPLTCMKKQVKLLNETPGSRFKLPETTYEIRKTMKPKFVHEFHYECARCKNYTINNHPQSPELICQHCNVSLEKTLHNFFVYVPLQQQLKASIEKNWESIFNFNQTEREEQYIADIHDGLICQNVNDKFPNTFNLSLVLNIDGAQVFKSSKKSLWPVQLYQNYLHPRVRYVTSNVIVTGLYFGKSKPDPGQLLFPLIIELEKIQQAGGFQVRNPKSARDLRSCHLYCMVHLTSRPRQCAKVWYNIMANMLADIASTRGC